MPGQTGVIRRDVGLRLFAMLCRGLFCRGIPLLRQAEHLQKREKQHNFREDHRHANRNDRMGQVTDQRQRDGRYAGAQPVMRGPAQVRNDKPQPRRQPGSAGGQQQLQIFVVGGIERFHPVRDARARPIGHRRVHHAGADAQQLAPNGLRQPAFHRNAPGRAAVGAPIVVEDQHIVQAAQAREARHTIGQQRQHRRTGDDAPRQHAARPVQRQFPPAQAKIQRGPDHKADHKPALRHMAQRRQHRLAALGVDVGAHILHPSGVEEEERPDDRQPPQRAGRKIFLADQHERRHADAEHQPLGIHHGQRQPAKKCRNTVKYRVPRPARDEERIEHKRQCKRHEPGAEVFLSQRREKLRALDNCRVRIRADEVDIKDVEHIQHRDQRRRDADAERQPVQNFLRRKRADSQIPRRREQHHHTAAVVAAKPPERGPRREGEHGGHHARRRDRAQRPKCGVGFPRQAARIRPCADAGQRAEPERERPAQGADAGEFDNAEVGEFIDIQREHAERGQQKRRGRARGQLAQLLGLGHEWGLPDIG